MDKMKQESFLGRRITFLMCLGSTLLIQLNMLLTKSKNAFEVEFSVCGGQVLIGRFRAICFNHGSRRCDTYMHEYVEVCIVHFR